MLTYDWRGQVVCDCTSSDPGLTAKRPQQPAISERGQVGKIGEACSSTYIMASIRGPVHEALMSNKKAFPPKLQQDAESTQWATPKRRTGIGTGPDMTQSNGDHSPRRVVPEPLEDVKGDHFVICQYTSWHTFIQTFTNPSLLLMAL